MLDVTSPANPQVCPGSGTLKMTSLLICVQFTCVTLVEICMYS